MFNERMLFEGRFGAFLRVFVDFVGEVTNFHKLISSTPKQARLPGIDHLEMAVQIRRPQVCALAGRIAPRAEIIGNRPRRWLLFFSKLIKSKPHFEPVFRRNVHQKNSGTRQNTHSM